MTSRIGTFVREHVATLDEQSSVQQAAELMADQNVGSLVVTRNGEVVGLFTERDLVTRVVSRQRDPETLPLKDVATMTNLVTISHDRSCRAAMQMMRSNNCRRLLVYQGDRFLGLASLRTVAYALVDQSVGRNTLANVFVGMALVAAVIVIVILVFLLPDMLDIAQDVTAQ